MGASKPSSSSAATRRQKFATLEPRIKNISQATIQKKWKPLPTTSQDKIRQLVLNIKSKRSGSTARIPPLNRSQTSKPKSTSKASIKEEEYEKIVAEITDKLISRLPRMPFPPIPTAAQDETPFDLSNTLHRVSSLQSQLTTNIQSAHLLSRQIKREQRALKQDRAELAALERGLKSSSELRRKKERGLHPIVQQLDDNQDDAQVEQIKRINTIAGISSTTTTTTATPTLNGDSDPDLGPLLTQLRSHLVSMQNNVAGMKPVVAAIDDTKMALDLFAARKLDPRTR
ncbi:CENP-Q, a CENPA-CAD centromere complex subunit-domain-containing protein [Exophiala viscosa]|uniref:CENP-Q, a CENPA-CAD centromere complex subunit-domain-containing protein n=1 Tax=Exophiala viscosa TaxID=2486360 RepID=UPI0021973213|nr:CENP-Q, a CENPA-CAD centromere complex subunit-domain-containing protein [Exophiala viscosa]